MMCNIFVGKQFDDNVVNTSGISRRIQKDL